METDNNSRNMNKLKEQFDKTLQKFININRIAPFPIIDTEHIMNLSNKIYDDNIDYDAEPVQCCSHCKSLYLITDDEDNDECVICRNSLNEIETHPTIFHYLNKYPYKNE